MFCLRRYLLPASLLSFFAVSLTAGIASASNETPFLGLQIQGLSPTIVKTLGLESEKGVLVRDIAFPGPTAGSDLQRGDVILEIDNKSALSVEAVIQITQELKSNSKVKVKIFRRGKVLDLMLPIGAKPSSWNVDRNNFATVAPLGLTFAALTDKVQERFNIPWGVRGVVVSLIDEEKAAGLDIKVGDVIVQVNQSPVWKPTHVIAYIQKAQKEKREMVMLLIKGQDGFRFALLPVPF